MRRFSETYSVGQEVEGAGLTVLTEADPRLKQKYRRYKVRMHCCDQETMLTHDAIRRRADKNYHGCSLCSRHAGAQRKKMMGRSENSGGAKYPDTGAVAVMPLWPVPESVKKLTGHWIWEDRKINIESFVMNSEYLPDDFCRCLDSSCKFREQCLRWIMRDTGNVRCASMYTTWVDDNDHRCVYQIEPK